jgi:hypothetical protein
MKRPAMRGMQHEAIPRHRSTSNPARFARPTRSPSSQKPVTSRVRTAPGSGSRRQTSSDDPITLISADPTPCDLAGRTQSLCNGDAQRTNPRHIWLLPNMESDNPRSERRKHPSTSRFQIPAECWRTADHLVSLLILKSASKKQFEKTSLSWSPVTESNRRPSPYHGHPIICQPATT